VATAFGGSWIVLFRRSDQNIPQMAETRDKSCSLKVSNFAHLHPGGRRALLTIQSLDPQCELNFGRPAFCLSCESFGRALRGSN
jgi:hypothetical protein